MPVQVVPAAGRTPVRAGFRAPRQRRGTRRPALVLAAVLLAAGCTGTGGGSGGHRPGAGGTAAPAATDRPPSSAPAAAGDPARLVPQVRRYAAAAGIHAQLLMAILYNESYKPHDPALERAWLKVDPGASLGVANMHQGTFEDTRRGRDFAGRDWHELPDDPGLAVEAAAWYLHDLAGALPATWAGPYTRDELLALGYNAGPGSMRTFAAGGRPGPVAQSYLDRLRAHWDAAARALR